MPVQRPLRRRVNPQYAGGRARRSLRHARATEGPWVLGLGVVLLIVVFLVARESGGLTWHQGISA